MPPIDPNDNAFADLIAAAQEADTMTTTVEQIMTDPETHMPPCQEVSAAGHGRAERLAAEHGIPARNIKGDPLTTCRNHPGRVHYAVSDFGADRDLCADCRQAKANGEPVSVMVMPGRAASAEVTRQQIGTGVLMSCGAREFVADDANGLLMFRVGPQGRKIVRKLLVRLLPDDTYAVEYGRTTSNPLSPAFGMWQVIEQETGIYNEDLAATVRRLGDRDRY